MKLLTKEIEAAMPKLYANENKKAEDISVIFKMFTPWSNWTWYVTEGKKQGDNWLFFGFVRGMENELGYFNLKELEEVRGPGGLKVERDLHFDKHTLQEVMDRQL